MTNATLPQTADPTLDVFGVCLKAHRLLYVYKEQAAAIPGFSELYDDLTTAIEHALSS